MPPEVVSVTAGLPPEAKLVPLTITDVDPTATLVPAEAVTVGYGRTVPTTTAEPEVMVYMVTTADKVCPASVPESAGTVSVSCVALFTVTLDTVMEVPPEEVTVAAGEPLASKLVPVTTTEVAPTAMTVEVAATVGMGRTVLTVTAEPLETEYMVTTAVMVCPAREVDNAVTVAVSCVAELTVTADTVMVEPPEAVSVTAGDPLALKLVPAIVREVAPVEMTAVDDVTVGTGRTVPTTAELLSMP